MVQVTLSMRDALRTALRPPLDQFTATWVVAQSGEDGAITKHSRKLMSACQACGPGFIFQIREVVQCIHFVPRQTVAWLINASHPLR